MDSEISTPPKPETAKLANLAANLEFLKGEIADIKSTAKRGFDDSKINSTKIDSHEDRLLRIEQTLELLCKTANVVVPEAAKTKAATKEIKKRAPSEIPAPEQPINTTTTSAPSPTPKPKPKAKAGSGLANNVFMYMNMNMGEDRIASNEKLKQIFDKMLTYLTDAEKAANETHGKKVKLFYAKIKEANEKKIAGKLDTANKTEAFFAAAYDVINGMFKMQSAPMAEQPAAPATIEVGSPRG